MTESQLDILLELVREPQPADDFFVGRVMSHARATPVRPRSFFTKTAAVAAAAVIVLGGAIAALVRSTSPSRDAALETTHGATVTTGPTPDTGAARSAPQGVPREQGKGEAPTTYRSGDLEWGYASDTKAYALDQETGLRLETEIYRTEFDTDVPQRVTLTLRNTGPRAVAVSGVRGCALMVAAYPAEDRSADQSNARPWQCATADGEQPAAQSDETFVLKSGGQRVASATVILGASGEWRVVGMCRCSYEQAGPTQKDPIDDPLDGVDDLGSFGADLPVGPPSDEPAEQGRGLVTPPIRVTAS